MATPARARAEQASNGGGDDDIEGQLTDLHRRYKFMEGSSKSWSDVSQRIIKRQRAAIEKLKKDNSALKHELALEEAAVPSVQLQHDLARLRETLEMYSRKIEVERRRADELDKQILACDIRAMDQRKVMGGINIVRETSSQINKQVKILENRLEKSYVRFNEAVSSNQTLRLEIDNLRRERVVFDQIYKRIEKELQERKRDMAGVIELTNIAYEARDQAMNEVAALRAQADREQAAYEQEVKELGKIIEADRRAKEAAALKAMRRDAAHSDAADEEGKQRKKQGQRSAGAPKDDGERQVVVDKVQTYDEAFAKIQDATGIFNIDELVAAFTNAEDTNFTLFNYVNELNKDIERLEEQLAELKEERQRAAGAGVSEDGRRARAVAALEEKLAAAQAACAAHEAKYAAGVAALEALKEVIVRTFTAIGCDTPATRELLGDEGVTEANVMQYLGVVEQRANEILQFYANRKTASRGSMVSGALDGPRASNGVAASVVPPVPPPSLSSLNIEPPSTTDAFDEDDVAADGADDEQPLTREELQLRTMRTLNRRAGTKPAPRRKKSVA